MLESTGRIWREGAHLIMPVQGTVLPNQCVKCGQPSDGHPIRKKFYWYPPLLALMIIFPGILIFAIVALIVRKKATVTFSVCAQHRARHRNAILVVIGLFFAGFSLLVAGSIVHNGKDLPIYLLMAIVSFLAALVCGIVGIPYLKPHRIDNHLATLKGAAPIFLDQFSEVRG
jgi:hypothetical protein